MIPHTDELRELEWPTALAYLKDLIVERPLRHTGKVHCPFCTSDREPELVFHEQTLLSSSNPDLDPNHHWKIYLCHTCTRVFVYQHKYAYGWYTLEGRNKVLRGVSDCFEPQTYTCAHCGKDVVLDEARNPASFMLPMARPIRYPYRCLGCGRQTEADDGGYAGEEKKS